MAKGAKDDFKRTAYRLYEQSIDFLAKMGGKTHSSIRESAVQYGRMANLPDFEIAADLLASGVSEEDVEGALRYA